MKDTIVKVRQGKFVMYNMPEKDIKKHFEDLCHLITEDFSDLLQH